MYITDIVNLLKEFDISVSFTKEREKTNSKNHKTEKVELGIIIKKKSMVDFANKIN